MSLHTLFLLLELLFFPLQTLRSTMSQMVKNYFFLWGPSTFGSDTHYSTCRELRDCNFCLPYPTMSS